MSDTRSENKAAPRVSIGLPVYNSEKYLAEALDSILTQSFEDFELIISDNASTDCTDAICRDHAGRDERIRYFCNDSNIGAARNYNRVFELAQDEYSQWMAHDDRLHREFLAQCVDVLDKDPTVVLCYARTREID